MLRTIAHILLLLLSLGSVVASPLGSKAVGSADSTLHSLRIASLNCENLFDTIATEGHDDSEFLPHSQRQWNTQRYWRKLSMLAREIASLNSPEAVDMVALMEVEGDTALRDLTHRSRLRHLRYQYILTNHSDRRGISTALLYREGSFRPLYTRSLNWQQRLGITTPTREVLHVHGIVRSSDTIDIMVCHMPSQGGKKRAKRLRSQVASGLRSYVDSLLTAHPTANIIIVGDMNDSPDSRILRRNLGAMLLKPLTAAPDSNVPYSYKADYKTLYNISDLRRHPNSPRGTYRYRGHWEMLDQCIVSGSLLNRHNRLHLAGHHPLSIVYHHFLLEQDHTYGGYKPWRTYQGPFYRGGFSDHLPIVVEFEYGR